MGEETDAERPDVLKVEHRYAIRPSRGRVFARFYGVDRIGV